MLRSLHARPAQPGAGLTQRVRTGNRTLGLLNAGAGLAVNYIGHGSQYQWAVTDYSANPPYLLGQYDPDDLTNGTRQPISARTDLPHKRSKHPPTAVLSTSGCSH
ncbi:MAG: hypothetical protein U0074_05365 [Kouleothrix sp.]